MDGPYSENDREVDSEVTLKSLPQGKIYHAFISYRDVDEDREWVNNLIEKLENLHQLKCCNHVYDFQPGRKIVENIKDAVLRSVKTLIILSKEYHDSHWCNFEVEYTHQMSMEMREQILIPVLKEDCEIPEHLKPFTYIDARGPMGSWLPRLVTAIESPVNCGLESKYSQVDFSTHYRNFDTVHEERSKIGCCRELPFKSRRYIPDSLNDKAFNINNFTYKGVLQVISHSSFFKHRHSLFPWCPTVCCGSASFGIGLLFLIIFYYEYVYYTHLPSDGDAMDKLKFRAKEKNITENELIHNQLRGSIGMMVFCGLFIVLAFVWLICCSVHILQKRKLMFKALMIANHRLIDHNLLVGFKHYKCSATVKVIFIYFNCRPCLDYLEQCFQKNNVDTSQCDNECCIQNGSTSNSTVNDSNDEAIISLLENEEITNNIEENDREKARDLLISMSVNFVQDFLEQKLENSETYRHTSRAVCMCEYAETHGLLPVDNSDSGELERGFRTHSDESTNHFANVV
ncbi:uncharacterized protein LOC127725559 isoform X1 [Mytilus californianus]|uniref:uncharacterized protein LOC127725559 isoform X1 n=1 Tax=Mytilus californianus TaxID=6549 RepID=UPI002246C038|nr:uncharacterized protein LOC127725559 isoform X1 [Mytilus californianus]